MLYAFLTMPCSTRYKSGTGNDTLLLRLIREIVIVHVLIDSSTHKLAFNIVGLHCHTSILTPACHCREAFCTLFMIVFGTLQLYFPASPIPCTCDGTFHRFKRRWPQSRYTRYFKPEGSVTVRYIFVYCGL